MAGNKMKRNQERIREKGVLWGRQDEVERYQLEDLPADAPMEMKL